VSDKSRLRIQADILFDLDIKTINKAIKYLIDNGKKNIRILDVGCADGYVTVTRFKQFNNCEVLGIDISCEAINSAKNEYDLDNFEFKCANISKIKKEEFGRFDLIFSALTLHHLHNPEGITHKLWSLVGDKGVLIIRGSDDGLKVNYPENDDLDFLLKTTNQIKGSSDREHGRKIYNHLTNLTPIPKKILMDFQVDSTVGLDSKARLDYYDDNYSFRANYAIKLANKDNATSEDKKLANTLRQIVKNQRNRFEKEDGIYSITVQNIAIAFKG
jgi:SAM-dependent methyltransferase